MTQYVFVSQYDDFMVDILELNDSSYLEQIINKNHVIVYYNPGNHRLYCQLLEDKTTQQTALSYEKFKAYIQQFNDQFIETITTDQGGEFKGEYQKALQEDKVIHKVINQSINDKLQLAPINGMCKYIRTTLYKMISSVDKNLIDSKLLGEMIQAFNDKHNKDHIIKLYEESPENITREEVEHMNIHKEFQNKEIEDKNKFVIGDVVKVLLKKEKLEKNRKQKWSDGDYRIIDRQGNHYLVSPINFDFQEYLRVNEFVDDLPFSVPVYFRKYYELKETPFDKDIKYFSFEMEHNSKQYQFIKILEGMVKKGTGYVPEKNLSKFLGDFNTNRYYKILVQQGEVQKSYIVPMKLLRINDLDELNEAEFEFWFQHAPKVNNKEYRHSFTFYE